MFEIKTDYENNSEDFWNSMHTLADAGHLLAGKIVESDYFWVTDNEETVLREFVESLDGWNMEHAPLFAPYPLLIESVSDVTKLGSLDIKIQPDDSVLVFLPDDEKPDNSIILTIMEDFSDRGWKFISDWQQTGDSDEVCRSLEIDDPIT